MIKLDNDFLAQLGLASLPDNEKKALLAHIYETLEMRVGVRLAQQMTNEQLDEFESFLPNEQTGAPGDEAGAMRWLETNFPNHRDVVADELEKLKAEIGASAPQILAASGGQQPQA